LDWYHLKENLYKVGGLPERLKSAETHLWHRNVDSAIAEFKDDEGAKNLRKYLETHRYRIVNYGYYQQEEISISYGAVESTIKQIGRRVKISGAQCKKENVPQVLHHIIAVHI
jgi:replicative DNA helicase